jgi:radical SAM protein with 4Fe4S-binding SPASM domain
MGFNCIYANLHNVVDFRLFLHSMTRTNWSDILNFLSKLTFRRCRNAVSIFLSYQLGKFLGRPVLFGKPFSISVEPTTACNLGCPECPSGLKSFTRPTGSIRVDVFKEMIDKMQRDLIYLSFYFQGEPFLNKGFLEMVTYASSRKIYTATSTNAHFLDDETARRTVMSGLDRLIISLDGVDQETYAQYRKGGELSKVIEGAKNMVKWRRELKSRTPYLVFQFLVVRPNEHQLKEVCQLAKEIGMDDVWFKTAQIYDYENDPHQLIPQIQQYSRYKKDEFGRTKPKNPLHNHCWKMMHSNVVTWDGKVVPCCFDKDAQHVLGDLKKSTMQEIWESNNYKAFRRELMKSRKNIDICANCSEGLKVWS